MRDQVTFVGQAPSRTSDPRQPLSGRSGRFLADLLGVGMETFLRYRRVNLLDRWPGKNGKGDAFPVAKAAKRRFRGRVVVLGLKTASALGLEPAYFSPQTGLNAVFVVVPHPSGVNRWWNSSKNRQTARRSVRSFVL
jgi:uracil-DNA glycosylase